MNGMAEQVKAADAGGENESGSAQVPVAQASMPQPSAAWVPAPQTAARNSQALRGAVPQTAPDLDAPVVAPSDSASSVSASPAPVPAPHARTDSVVSDSVASAQVPSVSASPASQPPAKVTIRDVARMAGVSPSTVSRAFAKPDRVSASTTKRIFAAADALGYHAAPVETVPSRGQRGLIAIIVPDIANEFFSDIIRGVERECATHGLALIVSESRENASMERAAFDKVVSYADGVILTSSRMPDAMIRKCAQSRPVVVVNRAVRGVPSVLIDNAPGVEQAVEYLRGCGVDGVTYLDGPAVSWSVGVRWNTIAAACRAHDMDVHRLWPGSPTFEGGFAFADKFMQHPTQAVIAHNDLMAIGFMAAMRRRGMEAPRDFRIIGFDDDIVARVSEPTLTSIRVSLPILAARAARLLFARIKGEHQDAEVFRVPSSLVLRGSTGR